MNDEVKAFWEERHQRFGDHYTPARLSELNNLLGLESLKDKTVLCIGVGDGLQVRDMVEAGAREVHAADISKRALDNVRQWVRRSFLHGCFNQMPSDFYDVAISHVVAQHLSNEALEHHLSNVIRSLTSTGTFYMQSAFSLVGNEDHPDSEITVAMQEYGSVYRSYQFIDGVVTNSGGRIVDAPRIHYFKDYPHIAWHGFKIQRRA